MTLTIEQIKQLKIGDTIYLKHDKFYDKSVGKTVTVSKIGRKYIELDGTSHRIELITGELTKDYRGYAPTIYPSEQVYKEYEAKVRFINQVAFYCSKQLTYQQAKLINDTLGLDFKLENSNETKE